MGNEFVVDISHQAIRVTLMLAAPMLLGSLLVGIAVSLFQAITQINEQTLAFIPKIVAIFLILVIASPFLMETMTNFTQDLILKIPEVIAGK